MRTDLPRIASASSARGFCGPGPVAGQNDGMTSPHQPPAPNVPDGPRWWVKPAAISAMNIAAVLVVVTFLIGWSPTTVAVVLIGTALGAWWFAEQRPGAKETH
jgi:Flp pilus assembly protein TadB